MATRGTVEAIEWAAEERRGRGLLAVPYVVARFARRKPLGAFGGFIVVALIVTAIFAPLIATQHWNEQVLRDRFQGPSLDHLLGTDEIGRDIFSRIVYGARVSVFVGFGAVAISAFIATFVGIVTGYYGGTVDTLMQRAVDIWIAFPGLILIISIISIIGQGQTQLMVVLGFLLAAGSSRVVRSAVIAMRNNQYIEAARVIGANDRRVLLRYILPNVLPIIIISASVQLGAAILIEASLSFLGYGVPPPFPSWGRMLSGAARQFFIYAPGIAIWPGLAITLTVFGFNMLGDALRDVIDPRLRGSR